MESKPAAYLLQNTELRQTLITQNKPKAIKQRDSTMAVPVVKPTTKKPQVVPYKLKINLPLFLHLTEAKDKLTVVFVSSFTPYQDIFPWKQENIHTLAWGTR